MVSYCDVGPGVADEAEHLIPSQPCGALVYWLEITAALNICTMFFLEWNA